MIDQLKQAAEIGSPTAQALLAQIEQEERQIKRQKDDALAAAQETVRLQRIELIDRIQTEAAELLAQYDALAAQIHPILCRLAILSRQLPSGVLPVLPVHLRRVHVPKAQLGPLEPLYPVFTSAQCALSDIGEPV